MSKNKTRGVVAAGHVATAEAGKQVLEADGNAVDAALASAFAACISEPLLTGIGAGGYMLVHDSKSGQQTLFDYAVMMPGKGRKTSDNQQVQMTPTPVDFGGTIQMFHGGHAAVGVPGFVAGLVSAHQRYGRMPLHELVKPAQALAKKGVKVTKQQAYLIEILSGVIAITPDALALFSKDGQLLREDDTFYMPDIGGTLDEIAKTNGQSLYTGDLSHLLLDVMNGGGLITKEDLENYKVIERKPATINYRGAKISTNPPPSSGGALIAHSLRLLEHFDVKSMGWHSPDHISHLLEVMFATSETRKSHFDEYAHDENILERLLADELLQEGREKIYNRLGNTTHISVIDSEGNAVSVTSSNGAGSGVAVPGTGILLNNILGEEDLNPKGFHVHPAGHRMTSMMSPTIVTQDGKVRLSVGSAGSNRIRSAILQTISSVLDFDMSIKEAIEAPRIHTEGHAQIVELEHGIASEAVSQLSGAGHQISLWKEKNLFFGGVQGVTCDPRNGELNGAGDPRRGGVAVTAK